MKNEYNKKLLNLRNKFTLKASSDPALMLLYEMGKDKDLSQVKQAKK